MKQADYFFFCHVTYLIQFVYCLYLNVLPVSGSLEAETFTILILTCGNVKKNVRIIL